LRHGERARRSAKPPDITRPGASATRFPPRYEPPRIDYDVVCELGFCRSVDATRRDAKRGIHASARSGGCIVSPWDQREDTRGRIHTSGFMKYGRGAFMSETCQAVKPRKPRQKRFGIRAYTRALRRDRSRGVGCECEKIVRLRVLAC